MGIITDNTSALTYNDMQECLDDMGRDVEILHLSPHTPQLNPIETEWGIKAAIADIFGDLDRMRYTVRQMTRNGEIPIVKMFDWLLDE